MSEVKTYQQADEPNDSTPATTWHRDDGTSAQRDLSGAWVEKGNWLLEDDGLLSKEGGAVSGPITGNHGHAPLDSPSFTTNATLDGEDLSTKTWVSEQITDLMTTIQDYIANALGGGESSIAIGQNIAFGYGSVDNGSVVPLPTYSSGVKAVKSEIVLLLPSIVYSNFTSRDQHRNYVTLSIDPTTLVASATYTNEHTETGDTTYDVTIGYIIVCVKS